MFIISSMNYACETLEKSDNSYAKEGAKIYGALAVRNSTKSLSKPGETILTVQKKFEIEVSR